MRTRFESLLVEFEQHPKGRSQIDLPSCIEQNHTASRLAAPFGLFLGFSTKGPLKPEGTLRMIKPNHVRKQDVSSTSAPRRPRLQTVYCPEREMVCKGAVAEDLLSRYTAGRVWPFSQKLCVDCEGNLTRQRISAILWVRF